jgi:hypothetical protein
MTGPLLPSPAERRLARELAEIRSQLETLKGAARATQLGNSTLFGAIPVRDGSGAIRQVIGQQQDGTFGVSAHNGPPPDRPSTPIATPSPFGAIIEWNGQLVSGLPADFSHCNVYVAEVPDAPATELTLVGSLSRAGQIPVGPLEPGRTYYAKLRAASTSKDADGSPLLGAESFETTVVAGAVVATTVLAGIVDDLALAAEAVTNAKLAANAVDGTKIAPDSIASPHIIARAIQALHVAADAIQAGAVAADVITGRELRALSILADHINTNAINAGHLQAGIIDADKLSAILILATRIILGDPTGARLEIDALGLDQFGEDGARTLQLGANPAGGNFLTIVDPANPQAALASIADNGVITAQSFLVAGSISYQGDELAQVFDALPRGLMTWGYRETGDYTTGMTGIMELEVAGQPGRMYRISHSACFVEPATPGTNPTTQGEMRLHYTLDGSRPTTSSAVLTTTGRSAPGDYGGLMANFGQVGVEAAAVRIRVLLTYQSHFGLSSRFITGGYSNGLLFWIEDVGTWEMPGGVSSAGAGTGATASATYRREWQATWARSWTNGGQDVRFSNGELVQGYFNDGTSGDQVSAFGFDDADIRASLAGATITSAELYLYAHHWYWNTGGYVRVRTHNSAETDTYPAVSGTIDSEQFGKPQGKWFSLPGSVGDGFRNGTIRGFALDARDVARDLLNYGRLDGVGWASPPRIRLTYRSAGGGSAGPPVGDIAAPTNYTATWNADNTVTTNWTPTPGSESTEVHEFATDPADTLKGTIPYPGGTRKSGNLQTGFTYRYAVRARTGGEVSPFSSTIAISNTGQTTIATNTGGGLLAPSKFVLVQNSDGTVTTSWTPTPGSDATEVHEMLATPSDTLRATIAYPGGTRTSSQLTGGRSYAYAVRAVQGALRSPFSPTIQVTIGVEGQTVTDPGGGGTTGGGTTGGTTVARTAGPGGIPAPAPADNVELNTADRGAMTITASGTASTPRIYDGGGRTCGAVVINANYIVFQNYNVRPGSQYGVYITGHHVTVQNCDIKNVRVSGDGDLNAFTVFNTDNKLLYNTAVDFVGGDPGGSHTDWCQTWVSSSHPTPAHNLQIIGNVGTGPANPSRNNSIPSIHQFFMCEGAGHGGNSGGSGNPTGLLISDNTIGCSWGQDIKLDGAANVDICRNRFVGSSDHACDFTSGTNLRFYSTNTVGSGYGNTGVSITAGDGPANPYATVTTGGTTTTPTTPTTGSSVPGSIYSMARWYLTLPIAAPAGNADTSGPWDVYNPELATFKHDQYFFVGGDGWVNYVAPVDGVTTSAASGATRSELREMLSGLTKASWGFNDGKSHALTVTLTCDSTSISGRKECIVGQIHDATGTPPIYLAINQNSLPGKLVLFKNGPNAGDLLTGLQPSTVFTYSIRVDGTGSARTCRIYAAVGTAVPSTPNYSFPISDFSAQTAECYFKAGAYNKEPITGSKIGRSIVRHKTLSIT